MMDGASEEKQQSRSQSEENPLQSIKSVASNENFLRLLRASNGNYEEENADTIQTKNGVNHNRETSSLSNLFMPPPNVDKAVTEINNVASSVLPDIDDGLNDEIPKDASAANRARNRSVSFDKRTNYKTPVENLNIPDLNPPSLPPTVESFRRPLLFRGISAMSDTPSMAFQQNQPDRTLTIDDLLQSGPYELEAETNILKAVEERQAQYNPSRGRTATETSNILTGVPEELAQNFSLVEETNDQNTSKNSQESLRANDDDGRSRTSRSGQASLKMDRHHRRNMTVEDKLAGITYAMLALDEGTNNPSATTRTLESPTFGSSAEQLGHTAALITGHVAGGQNVDLSPKLQRRTSVLGTPPGSPGDDRQPMLEVDVEAPQPLNGTQNPSSSNDVIGSPSFRPISSTRFTEKLKEDWDNVYSFFRPQRKHIRSYVKTLVCYIFAPFIGVAAILFYFGSNPLTGDISGNRASVSWWLLFCVRQVVTLSLSMALQTIIIDLLCVGTRVMLRIVGPLFTLLIAQSKGWPFVVFCWAILDFVTLCGDGPFAKHWGYWQDLVGLFSSTNPPGHVVDSIWNFRILITAIGVSVAVALKRFAVGLYLGRQTFGHYGEQLARVMKKMLLISEVAQLAKKIKRTSFFYSTPSITPKAAESLEKMKINLSSHVSEGGDNSTSCRSIGDETPTDTSKNLIPSLELSERIKLMKLLDSWEEPNLHASGSNGRISISAVLRFRSALTSLQNDYPFSFAFGPAYSREACIDSAQEVYRRLLLRNPDSQVLNFEVAALIAIDERGEFDEQKAKDLVKVFRPDREGSLSKLDFIKSVDAVYKEFRLLQASIENSSQIDKGFENIINIVFYIVIVTIILSQLGIDPFSLFLSLSSVFLVFAFIIGSASAKYFEGILFILVRRPYGIGDFIHVSNVEEDTSVDGTLGWCVQNVTLFETTCTWVPTQERASLSNGSLASSRIINWARSPHARFNIPLTFPIEVKYETIEVFKRAVEEYMKVRPREWLAMNGFRVNRIATEQGYFQVMLTIQHRDPWQNIGQVLDSKANLVSYCHEVQKKLGMQYRSPPVPIDLRHSSVAEGAEESEFQSLQNLEIDDSQVQQFRQMAQNKYNIRLS